MPATSEFRSQPEVGVLGLREARRSDSAYRGATAPGGRPTTRVRGVGGALRSARGSTCENASTGTKDRRSPKLGAGSGSNSIRPSSHRAGLVDITNVAPGRASQADKVKENQTTQEAYWKPLKTYSRSAQPPPWPEAAAAAAPAPEIFQHSMAAEAPVLPASERENVSAVGQQVQAEFANAQTVQEYASDIHNKMFLEEGQFMPAADYTSIQTDITDKMRTILVDWLVEVHMKYKLRPETMHLTVNLIDRYLTKKPVMRKRLQLVGVAAMFVASKFEEITPPELHDWVFICDNAYTKEDLLKMECTMLSTLSFQIVVPTAAHFFDHLEQANGCDDVQRETARYLLELGLLDMRMLQYKPSHRVAAALWLSNDLFKRSPVWPAAMVEQSHHSEQELSSCVEQLRQLLEQDRAKTGGQLQAVHKKFSVPQRHGVSTMVHPTKF